MKGCGHGRPWQVPGKEYWHLDHTLGSGNAKEGRSPRVIVEGTFTGQDDCLDVWAVAGEAEGLIPRS